MYDIERSQPSLAAQDVGFEKGKTYKMVYWPPVNKSSGSEPSRPGHRVDSSDSLDLLPLRFRVASEADRRERRFSDGDVTTR